MPPPFGSPVMYEYLRIVCKIEPCPPLEFGQKNGLNLSEDLFFLVFILSHLVFISLSKFLATRLAPLLKNSVYVAGQHPLFYWALNRIIDLSLNSLRLAV